MLAIVISAVFAGLGVWHLAMALTSRASAGAAIPQVDGRPLFVPSALATAGVGIALFLCALLVLSTVGLVPIGLPPKLLVALCDLLAIAMLLRAIGDFRYVGFFKSVRGTRFATMDTWCYSPVCLALSAGVGYVATHYSP